MSKKVNQIKILREEKSMFFNEKLKFKSIEEYYGQNEWDSIFFLNKIKTDMELIKNNAKQILFCNDTKIHVINEINWHVITKFEIIYEGEENNEN